MKSKIEKMVLIIVLYRKQNITTFLFFVFCFVLCVSVFILFLS